MANYQRLTEALDFAKKSCGSFCPIILLLGNGFSCACAEKIFEPEKKSVFSYKRLADEIDDDQIKTLFEKLDSCDFEGVIRDIKLARRMKLILDHFYSQKNSTQDQDENYLLNVAGRVKTSLIKAVKSIHPENKYQINPISYEDCKKFLSNFSSIYTLNYDLLLYWTQMQADSLKNQFRDGFFCKINSNYTLPPLKNILEYL